MANISKPSDINKIWSFTGDIIAPSDTKISQGWGIEIPPRQYFNYIDNKQDQAIAHINQHGIAVWDAVTEYQGNASYCQGSDGIIYKCLQTNVNQNPTTTVNFWTRVISSGALIGIVVITNSGNYTPSSLVKTIKVKVQGPGGAGGSTSATGSGYSLGGGGGSGGYSESLLTTLPTTVSCVLTASVTSFGSINAQSGGAGSTGGTSEATTPVVQSGGSGGGSTGGNILNISGGSGMTGVGTRSSNFCAGNGADSMLGFGGKGAVSVTAPGSIGSGYGSGGGGAGSTSGPITVGAPGAPGVIIIEEYS